VIFPWKRRTNSTSKSKSWLGKWLPRKPAITPVVVKA
jgi:hypothetical protein